MSKFAIIETGGKQFKVTAGQKLKVEKLNVKEGDSFTFDKVLLVAQHQHPSLVEKSEGSASDVEVGTPYIEGAKVEAKVIKQGRGKKKIVFRYHSKTRYRKKKGHRQSYTEIEITKI